MGGKPAYGELSVFVGSGIDGSVAGVCELADFLGQHPGAIKIRVGEITLSSEMERLLFCQSVAETIVRTLRDNGNNR